MGELVFDSLEKAGISANETRLWFLFAVSAKVADKLILSEGGIVA